MEIFMSRFNEKMHDNLLLLIMYLLYADDLVFVVKFTHLY